jgi:succinate-semialdehyde dehydrogenase / glutarate-semialdehyde dehydrogenase
VRPAAVSLDPVALVKSVPAGLLIAGGWREGAQGERFDVVDPATERPLATVAAASVDDGRAAVAAAHAALPAWTAVPPRERSEILRRAFEQMTRRQEQLATLIVLESGKTLTDARSEVAYAAEFFRWYAEEAVRLSGTVQSAPSGDNRILTLRQPVGVAVLVTPWNYPAAMATRKIGPALAAGCTVILKPASETPLTPLALGELLGDAGVPPGVVNILPYGLVSYVYTRDLARGLRVSEALDAGMVGLNRGLVSDPAAPFGGVKQSGLGRDGGHEGLLEYTETKYVATSW